VDAPGTQDAFLEIVARDAAGNFGADTSDGAFELVVQTSAIEDGPVSEFALYPPAPAPSVRSARVRFGLPEAAAVRVTVHDVRGREVAVLAHGVRSAGRHVVVWDGRTSTGHASTGVYFVQMRVGGKRFTQRVMLVR
jgi:hypothetical protein